MHLDPHVQKVVVALAHQLCVLPESRMEYKYLDWSFLGLWRVESHHVSAQTCMP